ncbi:MAG: urease accessory protein UreD [Rhizobiales bacterium]|nr:urease accessory protein UreD [Hyphomicrobiales bacterium]
MLMTADAFAANRAVGRIDLAVKQHAGLTRRAHVFEDGPLRVRVPGAPGREAEAVIVNTAGGIAGGDRLDITVTAGGGAALVVTSAAAEKVYRALGPPAEIGVTLNVGAGASLAWMPQETILFDAARLARGVDVELAADARLLLAEAIVFGRTAMGERVTEGCFTDRWRVRRAGRLIYAESIRLDGAIAARLAEPAIAGGRVAVATVLVVPGNDATVAAVRGCGQEYRGEVGVSSWNGIASVRLCAIDGAALRHDLALVLQTLRAAPLPRLWLN